MTDFLFLAGIKLLVRNKISVDENKKSPPIGRQGHFLRETACQAPCLIATNKVNYLVVEVSVGWLGIVVVSIGVVAVVSDGVVIVESLLIGGAEVSEPVVFSGVSQPTAAIAKKAMKRMLFMRFTLG